MAAKNMSANEDGRHETSVATIIRRRNINIDNKHQK